MARYIDADEFEIELARNHADVIGYSYRGYSYGLICDVLVGTPTADVAPVRHGKVEWAKRNFEDEDVHFTCCDTYEYWGRVHIQVWSYCPFCGAKLNLEDEEDG